MKKIIVLLLCLALAMGAIYACNSGKGEGSSLKDSNNVYGMGAVSTVRLLGSATSVKALSSFTKISTLSDTTNPSGGEEEVKQQAEKFNEYFTALDSFMGEDIVSTTSEANTDEKYPYETKLTINGRNFDGETVQYVMFFTETEIQKAADLDDTDVNDPDDDDDLDDDADDEAEAETEQETAYTLKGVMVVDGADYYLEGVRTVESEANETENELKIRAYQDLADKTSYVEMEQENSVEEGETETEYVYSIYSNGTLIEQTAVDFEVENENGKEEVEYELEFRKGDARGRYTVERETQNGKKEIKVKYNLEGKKGEFKISEIIGQDGNKKYEYSFGDNSKLVF